MSLVFENELEAMTASAKEMLQDHWPFGRYGHGASIFEEVPYADYRTDLVVATYKPYRVLRRQKALGHLRAMPDERKYRRSYRSLQTAEPITRNEWVNDDSTYAEDTAATVWDWLYEYDFIRPLQDAEVGQLTLDGRTLADDGHMPAVTVKYPDIVSLHAYELKQRDWETALYQAARAEAYADSRWVVMDAGGIDPALENQKKFRDAGVGLLSLDEDGLEEHFRPTRGARPADTTTRQMLNERALADLDADEKDDLLESARD